MEGHQNIYLLFFIVLFLCLISKSESSNFTVLPACFGNKIDFLAALNPNNNNNGLYNFSSSSNYVNLTNALNPNSNETSLIVQVFVQQEGSPLDIWTWSRSCLYVSIDLDIFPKLSLATIYPGRRTADLYITVPPWCPYVLDSQKESILENSIFSLQAILQDPNNPNFNAITAQCVCHCEFVDHVSISNDNPSIDSLVSLLSLSFSIALLTAIGFFLFVFSKLVSWGSSTKYAPITRQTFTHLLLQPAFWYGIFFSTAILASMLCLASYLVIEQNPFYSAAIVLFVLSIAFYLFWFISFLILCYRYFQVSWRFFYCSSLLSLSAVFTVSTTLYLSLFIFCVAFEVVWAILGTFLDPTWAIPLIALYASFLIHLIVWSNRIYFSITVFEEKVKNLTLEKIFHNLLSELLKLEKDHLPDILKFFATHISHFSIMGVTVSRADIEQYINQLSNNEEDLFDTLAYDIATHFCVDPSVMNQSTVELYLRQMEKNTKQKNWLSRSFFNKLWSNVNRVTNQVRNDIGLGTWELTFLAFSVTVIFILFVIFIVYGFNQITRTSIGLTLVQTIVLALAGIVSKSIADYKVLDAQYGEKNVQQLVVSMAQDLLRERQDLKDLFTDKKIDMEVEDP